jgi:hypothetical protein
MLTPFTNKLTRNIIGAMIPCQSPPQKPAGGAYASLYLEFEPATARTFAIGAMNYRTTLTKSGVCTRNPRFHFQGQRKRIPTIIQSGIKLITIKKRAAIAPTAIAAIRSAFTLRETRTIPVVKNSTDHIGASSGSTIIEKEPIRCNRNPGIGSGTCSRTIPQIASQTDPNRMNATPKAFALAAIVMVAHVVEIRRFH